MEYRMEWEARTFPNDPERSRTRKRMASETEPSVFVSLSPCSAGARELGEGPREWRLTTEWTPPNCNPVVAESAGDSRSVVYDAVRRLSYPCSRGLGLIGSDPPDRPRPTFQECTNRRCSDLPETFPHLSRILLLRRSDCAILDSHISQMPPASPPRLESSSPTSIGASRRSCRDRWGSGVYRPRGGNGVRCPTDRNRRSRGRSGRLLRRIHFTGRQFHLVVPCSSARWSGARARGQTDAQSNDHGTARRGATVPHVDARENVSLKSPTNTVELFSLEIEQVIALRLTRTLGRRRIQCDAAEVVQNGSMLRTSRPYESRDDSMFRPSHRTNPQTEITNPLIPP